MRGLSPNYLVPAVVVFTIIFSLSVYVAQKFESRASVVLAPALTFHVARPKVSALQYVVFDINTGAIITSRAEKTVVPIASVTKLFAASILLSQYDLAATTTITWADLAGEGAAGKLQFGQRYSNRDLLFPLLLESSNDAALVLERVTKQAIINEMNQWAKTMGATQTQFVDASGIADGNQSTASDLKLLLTETFKKYPHIFDITSLPQYIGAYTGWLNNNPVAKRSGYRGGKHGYTVAANRTLVAVFDETINGHAYTLGYIILGSNDIKADFDTLRQFINNSASSD